MSFAEIGAEIGALVDRKRLAYGDAVSKTGDFLLLLYPNGITPEKYHDVGLIVRVLDKLCRIATRNDPFGESPWVDCAGYSLLASGRTWARVAGDGREEGDGDANKANSAA